MDAPNGWYLEQLVRALARDDAVPRAVRNECHRLLLAIDTNDPATINEGLSRLREVADTEGVVLPDVRN